MVKKALKNVLLQNHESFKAESCIQHQGLEIYQVDSNDDSRLNFDLSILLYGENVAILEESCMASADMQWLFYSGERIVVHGPLVLIST